MKTPHFPMRGPGFETCLSLLWNLSLRGASSEVVLTAAAGEVEGPLVGGSTAALHPSALCSQESLTTWPSCQVPSRTFPWEPA